MRNPIGRVSVPSCMFIILLIGIASPAMAAPGDSTWVRTFDHDFYNWATPHDATFTFPDASIDYSQILLFYQIQCPYPPGSCDPWDRLGWVRVLHDTDRVLPGGDREIIEYEIARIVTPFSIGAGTQPDSCTWVIDVSDYDMLLHGEVTLRSYIESWIGGEDGWLVTIDFCFIEGIPALKPFKITNLWGRNHAVYGDPEQPIEDHLQPIDFRIDPATEAAKLRLRVTGHGQGNTANCAEFCRKLHTIKANDESWWHFVWRDDCAENPCSPQGGTWLYNRAGWCPGDKADPWDADVTASITPGEIAVLDYDIQAYENFCRPNNPDCYDGMPNCPDCDYNYTGHTQPIWSFQTQLIEYRAMTVEDVDELLPDLGNAMTLETNSPNPFKPVTWLRYSMHEAGPVKISIFDASGRLIRQLSHDHQGPGSYKVLWNGKSDAGEQLPGGVYFYTLQVGDQTQAQKMLLLK